MNHQTFERILRFRDMPGGMRDGVLVPHITPQKTLIFWGDGVCGSSSCKLLRRGVLRSAALNFYSTTPLPTTEGGVVRVRLWPTYDPTVRGFERSVVGEMF